MRKRKIKLNKVSKILIRVNKDEKAYAISAAEVEGLNTSELIRKLLKEHEEDKVMNLIDKIGRKNERLFSDYKSLIDKLLKRKRKISG